MLMEGFLFDRVSHASQKNRERFGMAIQWPSLVGLNDRRSENPSPIRHDRFSQIPANPIFTKANRK